MNNPLGVPALAMMPVSIPRTKPSNKSKTTSHADDFSTEANANANATTTSTPTGDQAPRKLHNSSNFFLSSSPPSAKDKDKDRSLHPRSMYLHLDPASASITGESSNASSRRQSLAISATGHSSRCSIDSTSTGTSTSAHARARALAPFTPSRHAATSVPPGTESAPLSVAAALTGLIAASCQAQSDLEKLNTSPTGRTAPLRKILDEVKSLKTTALLLHKFLRRVEKSAAAAAAAAQLADADAERQGERARLIELDVLITVLTASVLTVSELVARLETMVTQADDLGVSMGEMVQRYARSLAKDANRIDMVDFTITRLLSVLQVTDPREATRHQAQANLAVMDMLQADASLAGRMQQLDDTTNGLDLVPAQRRQELASRPPPGYSVPSPQDADDLPDYYESLEDNSVAIQPRDWSVYSGFSLADISALHRISLPLILGEIKDGYYYTDDYVLTVSGGLAALHEAQGTHKSKVLADVLGMGAGSTRAGAKGAEDERGSLAHRFAQKVTRGKLLGRSQ